MPSIRFSYHPAYLRVADGLSLAARYWRDSWSLWVLPVAAIALVNGLAAAVFGSTTLDTRGYFVNGGAGRAYALPTFTPAELAGPLAAGLVGMVAQWFITAVALAGLRGRHLTAGWVINAGLGTVGAALLTAMAIIVAVAMGVLLTAISPVLLLIGLLALVPAAIYVGLRLTFWTLAIFDGHGVVGGARFSWLITRGSVLRLVGWGMVAALLSLGVASVTIPVRLVAGLTAAAPPAEMLVAAITATFQVFALMLMAVLYESQRWRFAPPAMPAMPTPEPVYRSPLEPPPPPPPPAPPAGPWG